MLGLLQAVTPEVLASTGSELGRGAFGVVSEVPFAGGRAALKSSVVKEAVVYAFAQEGAMLKQLHAVSDGIGALDLYGMSFTPGPEEGTVTGHLLMERGKDTLQAMVEKQVELVSWGVAIVPVILGCLLNHTMMTTRRLTNNLEAESVVLRNIGKALPIPEPLACAVNAQTMLLTIGV